MKKIFLTMLLSMLALSVLGTDGAEAASPKQVEVLLNANKLSFPDAKPFQDHQGSVMVPIRFVSEALGGKISYSKSGGKTIVEIRKGDDLVKLTVGQTSALANGKSKDYGTKVIVKQNRTFVPLRLVSEGLGEKVEWDKVGRWVWIGEKTFRNTDDAEFKLRPLSDFKAYMKERTYFEKTDGKDFKGIKIIQTNQLPLKLGTGEIIYDIKLEKFNGKEYIVTRSSERNTPIFFMVKDDFVKFRYGLDSAFVNNKDGTATNSYPVISRADKFHAGKYHQNYDFSTFQLKLADYIAFRTHQPEEYIVAVINPFK